MTLRFLLDTNVILEPLKARPDHNVLQRLEAHQSHLSIPSVVWHELLFGCYRLPESVRRTAIETYLFEVVASSIPILSYDEQAAKWHASERARLAKQGKTPPFADGQIAAIAVVNNLILVTFNPFDYESFQDVVLEDWRA